MTQDWISQYFLRLGLPADAKVECTYEFLKDIQFRHVTRIPYENLDIMAGRDLQYSPEALFDKLIVNRRGGYCFELGALLREFLSELGFPVTSYLGRFLRGAEDVPVRHHRILRVETTDGPYIVDVGVGQAAPRYPVRLEEGTVQQQFGESYRFTKDPVLGWVLSDLHHGQWRPFFSFTEDPQLEIDFVLPSFYCEKHALSKFNKANMVAIKTEHGRKTLSGREYREFRGNELVNLKSDLTDDAFSACLKQEFGIVI